MKNLFVLLYFMLFVNVSAFCSTDSLFRELDKVLLKKEFYSMEKLNRISELKKGISNSKDTSIDLYSGYLKIFEEYKTINFDSALTYIRKVQELAVKLDDSEKIEHSKMNLAFILLSSGMFGEAEKVVDDINLEVLNMEEKVDYFTLRARYYYDLCDFVKNEYYCAQYIQQGNQFADSAISLATENSYSYYFISGLKKLRNGNSKEAILDYNQILNSPGLSNHQFAIIASTLSFLYYQDGQKTEAINLLIKATIADTEYSVKENIAMLKLADTLFRSGDNERAYRYVKEAMADAEYYGARHRQFEVGTLLPIIEGKQLMLVRSQKNLIVGYAAVVTFLILIIIVFIVVVIKQNKKLQKAHVSISEANDNLKQTNLALTAVNIAIREANRIKDEYIGYYFNINSDYIDKIDRFKRSVSQRLTMGRYEEIKQIINKIDLKKEREDLSVGFDRVFIKLFPNFVYEFNKLFEEDSQLILPDGQLLNTELRIFALIRLGIHDNDKIAKILNLSVNTIYTYKTRIKNRSFIPNDEFEERIMKIKGD